MPRPVTTSQSCIRTVGINRTFPGIIASSDDVLIKSFFTLGRYFTSRLNEF